MIKFGMNMPFYLMMLYGSIMIVIVLILRGLFRNRLPKFVFPVLWCVVILRFVIPFSVSSPLSIRLPGNVLSPIQIIYSSGTAISEAVLTDSPEVEAVSDMAVTVAEGGSIVNYEAGDEWYGQTVGYDNVGIVYDPVKGRISVQGDSVAETTEAYGGISRTAYSDYHPPHGSVFGEGSFLILICFIRIFIWFGDFCSLFISSLL